MKQLFYTILFSLFINFAVTAQVSGTSSANRGTLSYPTGIPLVIDGNFDEQVWKQSGYNSTVNGFNNQIDLNLTFLASTIPTGVKASFGTAWDNENLYIGVVVEDPNLVSFIDGPNNPTTSEGGSVDIFFTTHKKADRSLCPAVNSTCSPSLLNGANAAFESHTKFSYKKGAEGVLTSAAGTFFSLEGMTWKDNDYKAFLKTTPKGYNLEIAMKWSTIEQGWPTVSGIRSACYPLLFGNSLGFDIAYNPINAAGTDREASIGWNQCCTNSNSSMSYYYGEVTVLGVKAATSFAPIALDISSPSVTITDGSPKLVTITAIGNPDYFCQDVDTRLNYQVISPENKTIAIARYLSTTGSSGVFEIKPLTNGTGTLIFSALQNNTVSVTSQITVSNMTEPVSVSITGGGDWYNATVNWASTTMTGNVFPANAPQDIVWSVTNPAGVKLAKIDSLTGVLTSLSTGNGVVTVIGRSLADYSVLAAITICVTTPYPVDYCNLTIAAVSNQIKCRGTDNITLAGFSINDPIEVKIYYPEVNGISKDISPYFNWQINTPAFPGASGYTSAISGSYIITPINSTGNVTLTGTYKFNSAIKKSLFIRLNASADTNATCPLSPSDEYMQNCMLTGSTPGTPQVSDCYTAINRAEIVSNRVIIYPNPLADHILYFNQSVNFTIYSVLGQPVRTGKGLTSVDLSELNNGLYIFSVSGSESIRLVVNR